MKTIQMKAASRPSEVYGTAVLVPGIRFQRFVFFGKRPSGDHVRRMRDELRRQQSVRDPRLELFAPTISRRRYTPQASNGLRRKFERLASEWKEKSSFLSSPTEMAMIPAYQQIIGMGRQALPFILEELRRQPDFWFWALRAITEEDPVSEEANGDVDQMAQAWIAWGEDRGM